MRTILNSIVALGFLGGLSAPIAAQAGPAETARRVAAVASLALEEYRLGVEQGRIIQAAEHEEAVLFLENARADADGLPARARDRVLPLLDAVLTGVRALADADRLAPLVASIRAELEQSLGIVLDIFPAVAPSLARGQAIFREACVKCHGDGGRGDGPSAAEIDPPPADLTGSALAAATPLEFYRKVTFGVAGTDMPEFAEAYDVTARWDVALYTTSLRYADSLRAAGRAALARCDPCRLLLADRELVLTLADDTLAARIAAAGGPVTPAVVAWARTAVAQEELGGDRTLRLARVLAATAGRADTAVELAGRDPVAAERAAVDAYLVFEGVEAEVRARRPDLASRVEGAFAAFRPAVRSGDPGRVAAARAQVDAALAAVRSGLTADNSPLLLLGQSLLIILREGLEAILIIGALTAVLMRAGAAARRREVHWGAIAAIGASGVGALLVLVVFRMTAATQELVEGITMLLAAVVLFTVASWLVSKIEAARWRNFVGAQLEKALASRGRLALAGLAFLVVFREGIETVLFYAALYATADGPVESLGVTAGLLVGSAMLAVIYVAINRWGVRLPLRPIFAGTGVLLLLMAFGFAGKGVAELQQAGLLPLTRIALMPSLPALGIFPTVQTVLAQLTLLAAFALAVVVLVRRPVPAVVPPPA